MSSVAFAACCSEVGAGGETGSGEDGSGDCVMDTSDSGAGGSARGITHARGTGNSGHSGGVSWASVAPAAAVDHFNPRTDLAPVITVVAASTASNVSSVALAASAGKREKIQHPREAVKKPNTQADIRHVFSDPAYVSRVGLSAASLTNPFQAPILRQEVDHDPMPMDTYEGSSEQGRCVMVATNISAPSPRDLPPLQLKMNLPLRQVELDQMQTDSDERSQHDEEPFADKDTLRPRARAPSPWRSTLVPRHESNTRASGLRHDVFNCSGPLKLGHQVISPGSSALRHQPWQQCPSLSECPEPQKGRISRSPEQW